MKKIQRHIQYFLLKYGWKSLTNLVWVGTQIRLEVSSKCQLKCPLCITGTGYNRNHSSVGWGNLTFAHFRQLIDTTPRIREIELSNYGEILLNPELIAMLEYAYKKKIQLTALNGVNLNYLTDETAEALVKYQFHKMKISIDGASRETYKIYRVGGDFTKVIQNIQKINHYKKMYQSRFPKLKWQFIIFGHNEHELPLARRMAQKLGMGFKAKLNYKTKTYAIKNKDWVQQESGLGVATLEEYEKNYQQLYSPACLQLWTSPQVNWDGKLLGCCVNNFGDFGNVFDTGLENCLQGEKYRYAKAMILGKKPARKDVPCSQCKRYKRVQHMPFRKTLLDTILPDFVK